MTRDRMIAAFLHYSSRMPGTPLFVRLHARLFKRSGGRRIRRWFGAPVLVLEVRGRTSGQPRMTPLIHLAVPDGYIVTAANAGDDATPQWFHNLKAAGEGVVHVGGRAIPVDARIAEGGERDRLWRQLADAYRSIEHYTRYTDRQFPVVLLAPKA